ncbi:MAG: TIGR04423 family type III CRISPR-associated protein [Bacteroidales bacterium]|nr:TIGR04423 family type III CRISPR-associated protein [Bacteroidales bacterium]
MKVIDTDELRKQIPSGEEFQGYVWYSDMEKPDIYRGEFPGLSLDETESPFVIEAQLFDGKSKLSYGVRYVDGEYIVTKCQVDEVEIRQAKSYLAQWDIATELLFLTRWGHVEDELCCNMDVLVPTEVVFVGFKKG